MVRLIDIANGAPASGRRSTIVQTLELLYDATGGGPARIIEVGTLRDARAAACAADGWSTRIWAWYAQQVGGRVISIDPDPSALNAARTVLGTQYRGVVRFVRRYATDVIGQFLPADLLYLDGPPEPETHLEIWDAVESAPPDFVLFDDILDADTFAVKGALAIPSMLAAGYRLTFVRDRQALLTREA